MAGPAKKRAQIEAERSIRETLMVVTEYEEAVARLEHTAKGDWLSLMKDYLQSGKAFVQALELEYKTISDKIQAENISKEHRVPVIAIADLSQAASTEAKAWEDLDAHVLKLVRVRREQDCRKHKLQAYEEEKGDTQDCNIEELAATENGHESQRLKTSIEYYGKVIELSMSEGLLLFQTAYRATETANRAAKSNIEVPGIGTWSPTSASTAATIASPPAPTAIPAGSSPTCITITTAQIKVRDIPPDVKASANDFQEDKSSDATVVAPTSMTAIVKVDQMLSGMTLCAQQKQYRNVNRIEPQMFNLGDIGWFPVLRPTLCTSSSDIHTQFGYICAKSYPVIIVEKLDDGMIGLIVSTSGGSGLSRKGTSIKSRSVPIMNEEYSHYTSSEWGTNVYPKRVLRVDRNGAYSPPSGAYVDMLNTVMIPYDSRFKKEGSILAADALPLQQMRLSAFLATTGAGRSGGYAEFRTWLDKWGSQFGIVSGLAEMVDKAKTEARAEGMAQAQAEMKKMVEAQAKKEEKARAEAKSWEETRARIEAKDRAYDRAQMEAEVRAEVQAQVEAKERKLEGARWAALQTFIEETRSQYGLSSTA